MANDLNQCNFIGRLGQDPEQRFMASGEGVTNLSVAVGEQWKNKQGEKQENTEWVRCVPFGKLSDICAQYLKKGSKVYVSGKMKTKKWQDQAGNDRYTTEIIIKDMQMLDSRSEGAQEHPQENQDRQAPTQQAPSFDDDEDLPF